MSGILKDINRDSISKIVKQQRVLLDLTQAELAKKAGVSPTLIARLERGERYPSARTLTKLAKALDMNEIELFIYANYLSKPVSTKEMEEVTQIIIKGATKNTACRTGYSKDVKKSCNRYCLRKY